MNGVSLAPAVRDGLQVAPRPVLGELRWDRWWLHHQLSLHHGRYLLIRDVRAGSHELYDLTADPGQHHDLSEEPIAVELRRLLDETLERELVRRLDEG